MKTGDVLTNAVTGMQVTVLQAPQETDGRAMVVEYRLRPGTGRAFTRAHGHRHYTERFDILAGRAAAVIGGEEQTAEPGETFVVPPNTSHVHPWSISDEELVVRQTTESSTPDPIGLGNALLSGEILFDLARRGKVNANGEANPLQMAVIFNDLLLPQSYVANLPYGLQRVMFGVLAAMGRLLGYRSELEGEEPQLAHERAPKSAG